MSSLRIVLLGLTIALCASCASYSGRGLKPGMATEAEVRQLMGQPATTWIAPGGPVWAYPRGPLGVETYLVRFDAAGVLVSIEQVLDEEHFGQIKAGEMTQADVLHLIGPPFQIMAFPIRNEIAWDYRYRDPWGYRTIFSVLFIQDGRVKGKVSAREDGGGDGRH